MAWKDYFCLTVGFLRLKFFKYSINRGTPLSCCDSRVLPSVTVDSIGYRTMMPLSVQGCDALGRDNGGIVKSYRGSKSSWDYYFAIRNRINELKLNYGITVHKSQGSTYGAVGIVNDFWVDRTDKSFNARLWYVALSRAKSAVFVTCG